MTTISAFAALAIKTPIKEAKIREGLPTDPHD